MSTVHPFLDPTQFSRRILLCLTGMSPQIVTETLYALSVLQSPRWTPTEVHLVTTTEGARIAREDLFDPTHGKFWQLLRDYDLPRISFNNDFIYVLKDQFGHPLSDIRSDGDNEQAANFIEEIVRKLTEDPESSLHLSMAGGRKTMGFYAGYALSLFGRSQDRLSHVLVSHPFESMPEFYYPPKEPVMMANPHADGSLCNSREAQISLASIPFVRLRHILPDTMLATHKSYQEVVEAAQSAIPPHHLYIDLDRHEVQAGSQVLMLPPTELAFLAWFARRKKTNKEPLSCPKELVPNMQYAREYLEELQRVRGKMGGLERTEKTLKKGMDQDFFEQKRSRLNHQIMKLLKHHAAPYLIKGSGKRWKKYELGIRPEGIVFAPSPPERKIQNMNASHPQSELDSR